jgi:hypothetical protein
VVGGGHRAQLSFLPLDMTLTSAPHPLRHEPLGAFLGAVTYLLGILRGSETNGGQRMVG